uniref:CirpA3 n=1 Tax=Rhipicephalus pulchellus TaxID=72859 RepID=A0A8X6EGT9_RHIPC|nr:Chain A, CirpA3 [Rhipicephalus pulchellus]7B28_B Chain B, CirpA3 [Rhipicephalus pulchellus]7B28_C Chain C, CirpA3 [Rhipicephalus pulchellus]7B28_D Chain D, CirpA3 [Rhipicephalus pulchellus]7B28_E Chain E, CirpA3 [Rhipicephalus pulchellus]7B28_F Chain F, CirpA3 [Rhipicephalus pulchellus]7B28_G Chain G, CirpA3 [Rhipicephalus pulchellus]7B28_H Chain H, CirpA3 [Rhipicephalus pulchellus]
MGNDWNPESFAIDEFMNTTDDIWVLNTTQQNPQACKKDKKHNITENGIYFFRSHKENGQIKTQTLFGEFIHFSEEEKVNNRISISDESSGVHAEHLYYSSEDKKCGLVQVFAKDQNVWTELRVRGHPNYGSLDAGCRREYEAYVKEIKGKKNSTSPYSDDCQIKV